MTSTIQHYRSTTAGSVPPALTAGRIGINHTDGNLFYRNAAGAVTARSLRDYGTVLAKGDVASVANLTLSIDPAVIGIMRGFLLRVKAVPSATSFLELRFGDASTIYASSGNYAWSNFFENVNFYDYDAISSGTASNSLRLERRRLRLRCGNDHRF